MDRTKDKRVMNAESVARHIFCSDSDSDWNGSEEEAEYCVEDDSLVMDRLTMELGKMAHTCSVLTLLYFIVRRWEWW